MSSKKRKSIVCCPCCQQSTALTAEELTPRVARVVRMASLHAKLVDLGGDLASVARAERLLPAPPGSPASDLQLSFAALATSLRDSAERLELAVQGRSREDA